MAATNAGGAFGGMPLMNNGTHGTTPRAGSDQEDNDFEARLNTYIYDFFLKSENYQCARTMLTSGVPMEPPVRRRDEMNGADDNMHTDAKDDMDSKRPEDLPPVLGWSENSFLLDWFSCFWDFFFARKSDNNNKASANAMVYLQHTQQQSRIHREQQQQMFRAAPGMMPGGMDNYQQMLRFQQANGMQMSADLRQKALQNNRTFAQSTPQQLAQMAANSKQQQMLHQQQMRRDPSDMDINGQRPRTPSGDNAPSPSKRPRLEGVPFTGQQMMHNARGPPQGLPGQQMMETPTVNAKSLLEQHGINPNGLSQSQYSQFQQAAPSVQQKSIQVYAQNMARSQQRQSMSNSGMPGQASPMMQQGIDLAADGPANYYTVNPGMNMRGQVQSANGVGGNHALHDYQMQLMLLEQQNKKRLLMARQEQEGGARPEGQAGMPGAPGFAAGISPPGSRSGQSPGPNDQIKRGTPKIGPAGLPAGESPMPDGSMPQGRDSPAAMNYNGQIPPDMYPMKMAAEGMGPVGPNMRLPPSSHPQYNRQLTREQMEAAQRTQGAVQMQNGAWPPGQAAMMQQMPQPQQQSQGTPQQRAMPPPTNLPAGATTNGRPASPAQAPAPPTPSQTAKAAPKAKTKDKEPRKGRVTKKSSTAGAPTTAPPATDAENPPPTPTPSTPITPSHPSSFSNKNDTVNAAAALMHGPTSATVSAPLTQTQPDANSVQQFVAGLEGTDTEFSLPYSSDLSGDVLENFDFDSFLQSTDNDFNFDPASLNFTGGDGVEAGAGDA